MVMNNILSEVVGLGNNITGVISELVQDKDLAAKLINEVTLRQLDLQKAILTMPSQTKADAIVKVMYALRDVGVPLLRPIGAAAMTAFGIWAHYKGLDIGDAPQVILDGAFPGWMASRHAGKAQQKAVQERIELSKARPAVPPEGLPPFVDRFTYEED